MLQPFSLVRSEVGFADSPAASWKADNGNGTYSNPLFYDEFSDPDVIRVGDDYYMTGTTMHAMPGLPVLHSKDLVNWEFVAYAMSVLDYGPEYRLEDGQAIYGQGIWAPCFRHHNGTFYIFSNVNKRCTQVFTASDPKGPWVHREMKGSFHDLSVLFDDDDKAYIVWGHKDLQIAELNENLDDIVPGTQHAPFGKDALIGEGAHFYKIDGHYFITSAWYETGFRMPCARSDSPFGPYEVNPAISKDEAFGITAGNRLARDTGGIFEINPPDPSGGADWAAMHQGGIIQTQKGDWWGWSMMDANSVGRLTCLSPITWQDGWPYFGLPGNLGRTPRIWKKPDTGFTSVPSAPYTRNDDFSGPDLATVWQWNHVPVQEKWSLNERKGHLRLHAMEASDFWQARNTLTQRAIGPESVATVQLDPSGLQPGDTAGLALLIRPYTWIGVTKTEQGLTLSVYDQTKDHTTTVALTDGPVWLQAHCEFLIEKAQLRYSLDGTNFEPLGYEFQTVFQLVTFQGVRYGLFCYGGGGGHADFTQFTVIEPRPRALTETIPYRKRIRLQTMAGNWVLVAKPQGLVAVSASDPLAESDASKFRVVDRKLGRIALEATDGRFITVSGLGAEGRVSLTKRQPGDSQAFQWTEMQRGDLLLLSLASHRHLRVLPNRSVQADEPGAQYDRKNGASFDWQEVR